MQLPLLDSDPIDLADLPRARLAERLSEWGFSPVHAARLWNELYRPDSSAARGRPELPPRLRARLDQCRWLRPLEVCREIHSADGLAVKYLLGLADDTRVETVLMRYRGRVTACLSTQAGCPVGCVFCATGQAGFTRNLSAGEIVAQALHVRRVIEDWPAAEPSGEPETLRNIVLMGMGEPLLNYDAVLDALDILRDPGCLAIGGKRITLSTVGVPAGIRRLAAERRSCSLAVSLHAATQAERVALVPAARSWPLEELIAACRHYVERMGRKIFFEWTLIHKRNDSASQARAVGRLLAGLRCQVNLIPLNPTGGFAAEPSDAEALARFRTILGESGIPTSVRQRRGIEIAAGCGQLAGSEV